jgi:hypothetical protein
MLGRDTIITDKGHPIISNFITEGDGSSPPMSPQSHYASNRGNGDLGTGIDVGEENTVGIASMVEHDPNELYLHTPALPCISFINFLPSASIFEAWNGDNSLFDMDTMTSGVYKLNTIQHRLTRGRFTQRLSGAREFTVKTSVIQNEIRGDNK